MVASERKKARKAVDGNGTLSNGHGGFDGERGSVPALAEKTDYTRWRLLDERGRQTWHYLTPEEAEEWPQTVADKYHLGMATGLPPLPLPRTFLAAAGNALDFFKHLQLPSGQWACDYGGPMFLIPGMVVTWHVTNTPIPEAYAVEIRNYLFARQHPQQGGWGLHIEGESTVFGTAMSYIVLRILGVGEEDERMVTARATLHRLGGAVAAPHWGKFWMSLLGVCEWDALNPVPPELWLLPDWVPIAPWRWWIHMRQVFLPMSYIYSRRWTAPATALTRQLREELYVQPYESIDFFAHRNTISPRDNYYPKTWILNTVNWALVNVWNPYLRTAALARRAEDWAFELVRCEDENTDFACVGPVSAPMNTLVCYIREGAGSYSVRRHLERLEDFLWLKDEGMLVNGTNGVQTWDTSFLIQAAVEAGLATDPRWRPTLLKALAFLEDQQIREDCREQDVCYRQQRRGAWAFSNRIQGYTVSDCTSEAMKSVMLLQRVPGFPTLVSDERLEQAVDVLLTMQNRSGGFSSYEPARGSEYLECLNAAEVFGRIMVEYDYPECTTAVVTALSLFSEHYPDYRTQDIATVKSGAVEYIRRAQRADGSWYGSWGICFAYAGMFALESLASVGETYENSERMRRGCDFLLGKQMDDGGWGESYKSCETGVYTPHAQSQVVNTAWVCIGLMEARYPHREPLEKALRLIASRQQANGEFLQEAIEGVFNKSCMISYPNYKFVFPIKALGMFARRFGDAHIA
ncbi:MAG: Lanosterol synthase (Oxidosqualene--lanosterol cyclase) [Thelocarpon impressellum]|nr:MAG: Lanosterol synthase (Oxidosqualene--lanosterol cyclase) [Thelocarpon impressellum]